MLRSHTTHKVSAQKLESLAKALSLQVPAVQFFSAAFLIRNGFFYTAIKLAEQNWHLMHVVVKQSRSFATKCYGECSTRSLSHCCTIGIGRVP